MTYMGVVYIFDLCTGMRLGELLGLKWQDIDFEQNQLHIRRILRKMKDPDNADEHWHLEFGAPKTPSSDRIILLNKTANKVLADVWEQQEKNKEKSSTAYEDNDLVFATQLGRPLDPTNMRRTCDSICAKIGVSNFHPYCLRHTFTTRGAENNVDVRLMQKFLGHATIKETADAYTHILDDLKQDEIQKLDNAVNY